MVSAGAAKGGQALAPFVGFVFSGSNATTIVFDFAFACLLCERMRTIKTERSEENFEKSPAPFWCKARDCLELTVTAAKFIFLLCCCCFEVRGALCDTLAGSGGVCFSGHCLLEHLCPRREFFRHALVGGEVVNQ